jgi:hypothetical protein
VTCHCLVLWLSMRNQQGCPAGQGSAWLQCNRAGWVHACSHMDANQYADRLWEFQKRAPGSQGPICNTATCPRRHHGTRRHLVIFNCYTRVKATPPST